MDGIQVGIHENRRDPICVDKKEMNMGVLKRFFNQTRKPEGVLGNLMLKMMNPGHAKLADWGMELLGEVKPGRIIELGCGGGRNAMALLEKYPGSHVTAVDYSGLSCEKARECAKDMIAAGRCIVEQGDVSSLPYPEGTFDLATAFETIYFWPGLEKCFGEVYRMLKPEGYFLISNESDGNDASGKKFEKIIEGMKCHTKEEIEDALRKAGFQVVASVHEKKKPWLAILARK